MSIPIVVRLSLECYKIIQYGNHLLNLECAKVCLSLLVLLAFDYICPPSNLCLPLFTFAFN
jgi:hypothetical protein